MNHVQDQGTAPTATTTKDQAQIFAEQFIAQAGSHMKTALDRIITNARRVMIVALFLSMPHQITFLLAESEPYVTWLGFGNKVESLGVLLLAIGTPIVADLWIVNSIHVLGTVAASSGSKTRAFFGMLLPVGVSATTNFLAPAPPLIKLLSIFVVLAIPGNEMLKFTKPDWIKLRKMTEDTMKDFAPAEPVGNQRRRKPARHKVEQILAQNPRAKAAHVAKQAGVTENYVYLVRRDLKKRAQVEVAS